MPANSFTVLQKLLLGILAIGAIAWGGAIAIGSGGGKSDYGNAGYHQYNPHDPCKPKSKKGYGYSSAQSTAGGPTFVALFTTGSHHYPPKPCPPECPKKKWSSFTGGSHHDDCDDDCRMKWSALTGGSYHHDDDCDDDCKRRWSALTTGGYHHDDDDCDEDDCRYRRSALTGGSYHHHDDCDDDSRCVDKKKAEEAEKKTYEAEKKYDEAEDLEDEAERKRKYKKWSEAKKLEEAAKKKYDEAKKLEAEAKKKAEEAKKNCKKGWSSSSPSPRATAVPA